MIGQIVHVPGIFEERPAGAESGAADAGTVRRDDPVAMVTGGPVQEHAMHMRARAMEKDDGRAGRVAVFMERQTGAVAGFKKPDGFLQGFEFGGGQGAEPGRWVIITGQVRLRGGVGIHDKT